MKRITNTGNQLFIEFRNRSGYSGEIFSEFINVDNIFKVYFNDKKKTFTIYRSLTSSYDKDYPYDLNQTFIEWFKKHTLYAEQQAQ